MSALLSFGDVLEGRIEDVYCPGDETARITTKQQLDRLVAQEWPDLPYIMMRVVAAARPRDGKRFYWRDLSVQSGDIELNLIRSCSGDATSTYTAIYSRGDYSRRNSRHDFLVPLHPSLEDDGLRWNATSICDSTNLSSRELVGVLLAKLVSLDTGDFAQLTRISPAGRA